jgi:cation diffusion facilitator CzcD-associated flavoprotein CzcO
VIDAGVSEIRGNSVISSRGEEREVDAIVLGTGFHVTDLPIADHVRGTEGTTLADAWEGSMQAYRGSTVPGFPNFFFVLGPNTGLGHSSMIFMVEASVQYVIDALQQMEQHDIAQVDVRPERYRHWNDGIQRRMPQTVWVKGGCASWYVDANGRNTTLWPDFTFKYRALTKRFDLESYSTLPKRAATEATPEQGEPAAV